MIRDPAFWLGVYGSALSTLLAYRHIRDQRRTLRVSAYCSVVVAASTQKQAVTVAVVNRGHRPVTITNVAFQLDDRQTLIVTAALTPYRLPLPKLLGDGEPVYILLDRASIRDTVGEGRKITHVMVRDAEGGNHRARVPKEFMRELQDPD